MSICRNSGIFFINIDEFWTTIQKQNEIILQTCENVWQNVAECLNSERCKNSSFESLKGNTQKNERKEGRKRKRISFLNLCNSYSHLLSTHICAVPTRLGRAECRVHLLFSTSRRPHCVAVVCWFLFRGCVFRLDDACQKRFSWFPDWIQKVQKRVNLVDLVKSFRRQLFKGVFSICIKDSQ